MSSAPKPLPLPGTHPAPAPCRTSAQQGPNILPRHPQHNTSSMRMCPSMPGCMLHQNVRQATPCNTFIHATLEATTLQLSTTPFLCNMPPCNHHQPCPAAGVLAGHQSSTTARCTPQLRHATPQDSLLHHNAAAALPASTCHQQSSYTS